MIFTFEGTIEDVHGLTHVNPVFAVKAYNYHHTAGMDGSYDEKTGEYHENDSTNKTINYSIVFWPNQSSKDSGKKALVFYSETMGSNIAFSPTTVPVSREEVKLVIKDHFLVEILPAYEV